MPSELLSKTWEVDGVLTNATSAKLSDPTGTYGVRRNDTMAVVVADGTDMTAIGTGQYNYTVTTIAGISYTAWIEIVYNGSTYYFEVDFTGATAATVALPLDYTTLKKEVAFDRGWTRDSAQWSASKLESLDSFIRSGLNQFYAAHEWSFFFPKTWMTTSAPYSTGTITIVAGVVTLAGVGAAFPTWAADGELVVNGITYSVASYDNANQITLDDTSVAVGAGATYSLNRAVYSLPADFGAFLPGSRMTYRPGSSTTYPPVKFISEGELRVQQQYNPWGGTSWPRWFAQRPKTFDPTTGQRYEAIFYPTPNAAYVLEYRYQVLPGMLSAANPYPLGGQQHGEAILLSCLAIAEQRVERGPGAHTAEYQVALARSIALDQNQSTPDFMGYCGDKSRRRRANWARGDLVDNSTVAKFNGIEWD